MMNPRLEGPLRRLLGIGESVARSKEMGQILSTRDNKAAAIDKSLREAVQKISGNVSSMVLMDYGMKTDGKLKRDLTRGITNKALDAFAKEMTGGGTDVAPHVVGGKESAFKPVALAKEDEVHRPELTKENIESFSHTTVPDIFGKVLGAGYFDKAAQQAQVKTAKARFVRRKYKIYKKKKKSRRRRVTQRHRRKKNKKQKRKTTRRRLPRQKRKKSSHKKRRRHHSSIRKKRRR
jgi:hypothetical protein